MKKYQSTNKEYSIEAQNSSELVDIIAELINKKRQQTIEYHSVVAYLCTWLEGASIVLEHGNAETFLQMYPSYKQHMIDYLKSEGFDTSMFVIKDTKEKIDKPPESPTL